MADTETETKATRARLVRLYEVLRETQAKCYEITEEIGRLLNGADGVSVNVKRLEKHWSELWAGRYGSPYLWQYVKDKPQMKRLLRTVTVEEIEARMLTYIKSDERFYVTARHPFGIFVSSFNRLTGLPPAADLELAAPPVDCRHTPPCASDQEHTRRRMSELRV